MEYDTIKYSTQSGPVEPLKDARKPKTENGFGNTVKLGIWSNDALRLFLSKSKYIGRSSSVGWEGKRCSWSGGTSEQYVEGADLLGTPWLAVEQNKLRTAVGG